MIYDNVIKIRGPYKGKDGRLRVNLVFSDKTETVMSYPKYLMEIYLNRHLTKDETVDHIDGDPLNNDISNLRILLRGEHCKNDTIRNEDIITTCLYCGKEFTIPGNKLHNRSRNRNDRNSSGYFCSKECSGKYGSEIQNHRREKEIVKKLVPNKYTLHKNDNEKDNN
jgi:hypothetical protein